MSIFNNKREKALKKIVDSHIEQILILARNVNELRGQINAITKYLKIDLGWVWGQNEEEMERAIYEAKLHTKKIWRATKIKKQKNKNEI